MTAVRNKPPVVALMNRSTNISDEDAARCAKALNIQVDRDFSPFWGLNCTLVFVGKGKTPPKGSWQLFMIDNPDVAGALGYHDLTKEGYPVGKIFTKLQSDTDPWTTTASHELLELLADPYVYLSAGPDEKGRWLAYEVCDSPEALSYAIPVDGHDVLVSDFVTPAFFGDGPGPQYDYLGKIKKPGEILPGGYLSYWTPNGGWQQAMARDADDATLLKAIPHPGSRRERRRRLNTEEGQNRWRLSAAA
jgi:hypothetical protein